MSDSVMCLRHSIEKKRLLDFQSREGFLVNQAKINTYKAILCVASIKQVSCLQKDG
jgi:hypothetical protein